MYQVQQLIEQLREIAAKDFSKSSGVIFMVLLRDQLVAEGFYKSEAEQIVTAMTIEVADNLIDPEELQGLVMAFSDIMVNLRNTFKKEEFIDPVQPLLAMASKFELKLS